MTCLPSLSSLPSAGRSGGTLGGLGAEERWGGGGQTQPLTIPLALRYHTGSLAFGALILAIVQIIRVMLEYLDQRLKGEACRLLALALNWEAGPRGRS